MKTVFVLFSSWYDGMDNEQCIKGIFTTLDAAKQFAINIHPDKEFVQQTADGYATFRYPTLRYSDGYYHIEEHTLNGD